MVRELITTERVKKMGNSYYINLRKEIREELGVNDKDLVEIRIKKIEKE